MDELDRQLIALLRNDGRTTAVTLAKALKVSRGTVQNRIDRLTAQGVIAGFTVRLHAATEAGRVRAFMTIAVEGRRAPAVLRALQGVPEVEAVHTTNGRRAHTAPRRESVPGKASRRPVTPPRANQ